MFHTRIIPTLVLACVALLPLGCGRADGTGPGTIPLYELTAAEVRLARELAETRLLAPGGDITPQEKFYFIKAEILPDSQAETTQRLALLTHYRYQGNQTIHTLIDLNTQQVQRTSVKVNFPCGLAKEEQELALQLVRNEPRLANLLAEHGARLDLQTRLSWGDSDESQPQRLVHILFRVGDDYLTRPVVRVDLATNTVQVQ